MRVLNLSINDWANYAHDNANALRSIGVDCRDATFNPSPFNYKTQSPLTTRAEVHRVFKQYDVIQVFHSENNLLQLIKGHPKVIVYHTGTRYRQQSEFYDKAFKGCKVATDQCEFLIKQHMNYIAPHVNFNKEKKRTSDKLIIGHFPSNPEVKGTRKINEMLKPFKDVFDIRVDSKKLSHSEHLKRVSECDIYIELFAPLQRGVPYGCFGTSAFEATSLGCLTITNNINQPAYEDVYGLQPFLTPNTENDFKAIVESLKDIHTFEKVKQSLHSGFYDKHNIKATGKRIKEVILL